MLPLKSDFSSSSFLLGSYCSVGFKLLSGCSLLFFKLQVPNIAYLNSDILSFIENEAILTSGYHVGTVQLKKQYI